MKIFEQEDIRLVAELPYNWFKLKNKTILISGATGFIGSFLIEVFKYRNEKYKDNINVYSLSRTVKENNDTVTYYSQDVTKEIRLKEPVNFVIHLASNTHPLQYEEDPIGTVTTNILGCINLLEYSRKNNVEKFVLASSFEVYGQGADTPMSEDFCGYIDSNMVRSGYGESKRLCEILCRSYLKQYNLQSVMVRFARVFGPDKKKDSKAIAQFFDNVINGENVIIKSNGQQRYSYVYIADAVSALIKVLIDGKSGEAYNVAANDINVSLLDCAMHIACLANKKVEIKIENGQYPPATSNTLLNTDKIKLIGWSPCYSILEGLDRTFQILL